MGKDKKLLTIIFLELPSQSTNFRLQLIKSYRTWAASDVLRLIQEMFCHSIAIVTLQHDVLKPIHCIHLDRISVNMRFNEAILMEEANRT